MQFTHNPRRSHLARFTLVAAMAAVAGGVASIFPRQNPRGALTVVNVGRNNQRYPIKDIFIINNSTNPQPQGAVQILSWTADGVAHVNLGASSAAVINSHQKGIVLDAAGIAAGATGRVRVQGPVQALVAANGTYSAEDPLFILDTANFGATLTLKGAAVQSISAATQTGLVPASAVAFVPTSVGSNASAALISVIFDGTDVNSVFIKQTT